MFPLQEHSDLPGLAHRHGQLRHAGHAGLPALVLQAAARLLQAATPRATAGGGAEGSVRAPRGAAPRWCAPRSPRVSVPIRSFPPATMHCRHVRKRCDRSLTPGLSTSARSPVHIAPLHRFLFRPWGAGNSPRGCCRHRPVACCLYILGHRPQPSTTSHHDFQALAWRLGTRRPPPQPPLARCFCRTLCCAHL